MRTVLTIAGFDPSSGAGISADLQVFAAHGLFGTSCITSLTVQSTLGVESSHPVAPQIVAETLACLQSDVPPCAIKIGMLATASIVERVADFIQSLRLGALLPLVIVDPVLRSTSGRELLDDDGMEMLGLRLLPQADWITPNLDELALLTGRATVDRSGMTEAAQELQRRTVRPDGSLPFILAKGGHLDSPEDKDSPDDLLLISSGEEHWLTGERVKTTSTHGTGCALSSALLCRLMEGDDPLQAARNAKAYVAEAMRRATPVGHGNGPMNLLWPLR